jgi:hypothetical protein
VGPIDLHGAVQAMRETVCGGIETAGELVTVRHAASLLNMDINELERPLLLVTTTADTPERQFQDGDTF